MPKKDKATAARTPAKKTSKRARPGAASAAPDSARGAADELHQRAEGDAPALTTNQGLPRRRQPELAARAPARPDAARGLHPAREDHALRPRAHPRAHRARARLRRARLLRADRLARGVHDRQGADRGGRADAGVRALLHRRRRRRLGRHAARRARLRRQVLHQGGQLGPRRQQHPGVLHPGRDQVPRPGPRGEDGAGPRLPAVGQRPRHLLGLHLAHARVHAHGHVDHVRSHDPALAAHDRRLRRPHLPAGQRRRAVDLRQVPLAAQARPAVDDLGRGGQDRRRRPGLPPPRPVRGHRGRRLPRVGIRRAAVHAGGGGRVPLRPPRRRPS